MNKNAVYRELFTQTEARVIIPAAKNLIMITQKHDEAICFLDSLENTEYNFIEVDRPETKLAIMCAERTVDAIIAEKAQMEREFRKLFVKYLKKTSNFQEDNLGFVIEPDAEAACKVVREIESEARFDCSWFSDDELTDSIINTIINGLIFSDCCPALFFRLYEEDEGEDEDDCYLDSETVEEAIASVEEYLEELKEKAVEIEKEAETKKKK